MTDVRTCMGHADIAPTRKYIHCVRYLTSNVPKRALGGSYLASNVTKRPLGGSYLTSNLTKRAPGGTGM
jgi:hypothetical protein